MVEKFGRDTVVILEKYEYPHLSRRTLINCNSTRLLRESEIDIRTRKSPISDSVHGRIIRAIKKSGIVAPHIKQLFRG